MHNKIFFILAAIATITSLKCNAQNDTIYVYEDIISYDTIVVYDTVYERIGFDNTTLLQNKPLNKISTNKNEPKFFLIISDPKSATFGINEIILNENNLNLENMKKLGFLSVVFFAFNTMVLAQTEFEVSVGSGIWWQTKNIEEISFPKAITNNIGVYANRNINNLPIGIKIGVEYAFLQGINKNCTWDNTYSVQTILNDINNIYKTNSHNITVPLLLYFNKFAIVPFAGINYNYLHSNNITDEITSFISATHNFGLEAGLNIKITPRFSATVDYRQNLTADKYSFGNAQSDVISDLELRNAQLRLSVTYKLKKAE